MTLRDVVSNLYRPEVWDAKPDRFKSLAMSELVDSGPEFGAGLAAAGLIAPNLEKLNLKMGVDAIRDQRTCVSYAKQLEDRMRIDPGFVLTTEQAEELVGIAKQLGVHIGYHPGGHENTDWTGPHLHIGDKARAHIRVPEGYQIPK